jgi:hypothetical protein
MYICILSHLNLWLPFLHLMYDVSLGTTSSWHPLFTSLVKLCCLHWHHISVKAKLISVLWNIQKQMLTVVASTSVLAVSWEGTLIFDSIGGCRSITQKQLGPSISGFTHWNNWNCFFILAGISSSHFKIRPSLCALHWRVLTPNRCTVNVSLWTLSKKVY